MTDPKPHPFRAGLAAASMIGLAACNGMDFDLRGATGSFSTAAAAQEATASRPEPDERGIISYPNYQVAVARRGDTLNDVATRIGVDANILGSFNGIPENAPLRQGEIIALPGRVREPSPSPGTIQTAPLGPSSVDVTTLAGRAIDSAPASAAPPRPAAAPARPPAVERTDAEPTRHKVARGETAYSIARLYDVPVRALAEWNGLGPQFTVREGQYLLIPVAKAPPPARATNTAPGEGTPTPTPPSAEKPLPKDDTVAASQQTTPKPVTDLGERTKPASTGRFAYPVQGTVIREYAKGRNEGINIQAAPGTSVKAAEAGTVAAITESSEGVPIIVLRHADNLLTVYANVTDVSVAKGDTVRRGQGIAKLRAGDQSFVHFEVREGFESVDPNSYLN